MDPEELISAWEDAYREYADETNDDLPGTSLAVAKAWCALAESVDLPWWLAAAVRSAAEAFEQQGEGDVPAVVVPNPRSPCFCTLAIPLLAHLSTAADTTRWPRTDIELVNVD